MHLQWCCAYPHPCSDLRTIQNFKHTSSSKSVPSAPPTCLSLRPCVLATLLPSSYLPPRPRPTSRVGTASQGYAVVCDLMTTSDDAAFIVTLAPWQPGPPPSTPDASPEAPPAVAGQRTFGVVSEGSDNDVYVMLQASANQARCAGHEWERGGEHLGRRALSGPCPARRTF